MSGLGFVSQKPDLSKNLVCGMTGNALILLPCFGQNTDLHLWSNTVVWYPLLIVQFLTLLFFK